MSTYNLKKRCKNLNNFLNQEEFYSTLATYSNYDFATLITNLSLIIAYYLNTDTPIVYSTLEELFAHLKSVFLPQLDYFIYPSNSYEYIALRMQGINPKINILSLINKKKQRNLKALEKEVSFSPIESNPNNPVFYTDIKESLFTSLGYPAILFQSILKQPTVTTSHTISPSMELSENTYYQNILKERLLNIHDLPYQTGAVIGAKAISTYANRETMLTIIPASAVKNSSSFISPCFLSFIKLPSKYTLLALCNQKEKSKEKQEGKEQIEEQPKNSLPYIDPITNTNNFLVAYSRYEYLSITDEFIYSNPEFTGDIEYDIDLIYGRLDSNRSRPRVAPNFFENLDKIRMKNDISVRQIGGQYEITNGRHRLLYLKHFYVRNYEKYKEKGQLQVLKDYLKLPINVERYIESPELNDILKKIARMFPNSRFLKANIHDDAPHLLILINEYAYTITSVEEANELYFCLQCQKYRNKYFLNYNIKKQNASEVFDYLIVMLKEKIFSMNSIDIINYLNKNDITIDNQRILLETLDLYSLYLRYLNLQSMIQTNELYNSQRDLIEEARHRIEMRKIGKKILDIIKSNPERLEYNWNDLFEFISTYPDFKGYDSDYLHSCANLVGFQEMKYHSQKIHIHKKV